MTLEELSGPSNRSLLLVHGRGFKPGPDAYMDLSMAALRAGIARDYPDQVDGFDAVNKHLAYYGDVNAEVLAARGKQYDVDLDIGDRRNALTVLKQIEARKRFGIRQYDQLPGKSAVPEFVADLMAPLLGSIGLSIALLGKLAPDFAAYFDSNRNIGTRIRERVRTALCELLDRGERVLLIAHGTGSVIAYDVLWALSHDPDLKERYGDNKVEVWVTLGSPLGDRSMQRHLRGAKEKPTSKFPANVIAWHNVAAEDDYICHDNTLADDFRRMLKQRVLSAVHDYHVFNLAVRYGRSNPHSSVGYYIHPRSAKIIADWLCSDGLDSPPTYTL
ncbi:MAG: hypothetical protein OES79_16105 [Planctomycetota bacterium]|nr:hypothetical protein [Planctomycetota bacterium]